MTRLCTGDERTGKVIAALIIHFGMGYTSVLYDASDFGRRGVKDLTAHLGKKVRIVVQGSTQDLSGLFYGGSMLSYAYEILRAIYAKMDIDTDDLQHFAPNSQAFLHACVAFKNEKAARTLLRAGWSNFRCPAKDKPNSVLQIIPTTIDTRDVTLSTILV